MRSKVFISICLLVIFCCKKENSKITQKEFNKELIEELKTIVEIDQIAAGVPSGKYNNLNVDEWKSFKDSVFGVNYKKVKSIFNKYGFPGFDLVGKEGSQNFWLIVQHLDHKPEFQKEVLNKMKEEVLKNNAHPDNYAYLTDRVKLNFKQKQVFGTQVYYNWKTCQAYPKPLFDSANINRRRKELGLVALEVYLNEMSKNHYEMNKEIFLSVGIKEPKLYEVKNN